MNPPASQTATRRELEVLDLVLAGLSVPEIAERLVLTAATVEHHIQRLRRLNFVPTTRALAVKILTERLEEVTRDRDECRAQLAVLDRRRSR
mgnify:FL=1